MNKQLSTILFSAFLVLFIGFPSVTLGTKYAYDELNRLIQVRYDDGTIVKYTYDAMGNRLTQEIIPNQHKIRDRVSVRF
jgi:YD repeat-containing protein